MVKGLGFNYSDGVVDRDSLDMLGYLVLATPKIDETGRKRHMEVENTGTGTLGFRQPCACLSFAGSRTSFVGCLNVQFWKQSLSLSPLSAAAVSIGKCGNKCRPGRCRNPVVGEKCEKRNITGEHHNEHIKHNWT